MARDLPRPADFPALITDRVRYSDTDRQGHVNNLQFGAFLEAGRAHVLFGDGDLTEPGCFFVIAKTTIEFVGELTWPGEVVIGSRIERLGSSSATFAQALFQDDRCAAVSDSVMVHIDAATKCAVPLSAEARQRLDRLAIIGTTA